MNSKIVEIQLENPNDNQRQSLLIDEAFERIMSHTVKGSEHEDLAMAAFDVACHAFSPLRTHDFKTAVHHILESRRPRPTAYPAITDVIEATGGLLTVQQDSVVTWFHPSLSQYFERNHARWFPSGNASMALACLTELVSMTEGEFKYWDTRTMVGYAACSWGKHMRTVRSCAELEDMAMKYLGDDEKLKLGISIAYAMEPENFDIGEGLAAAHVCAIFGITNLLRRLPSKELNRQVLVTGRTPQIYACSMGHVDTVEFLIKQGADPNLKSAGGSTALHQAIKSNHPSVVEALLRSPEVELTPVTIEELTKHPS